MKMEISVLYALLRRMGFLKISIMKAVALHFGFSGWNERKFYPTTPKHKSIGTTSMFLRVATPYKAQKHRAFLQALLGHKSIGTTSMFLRVATPYKAQKHRAFLQVLSFGGCNE